MTPSASRTKAGMRALLGWDRDERASKLTAEHARDGVRVDGVRIDGPCFGSDGWYVIVREQGKRDRHVTYNVYLKTLAREERARAEMLAERVKVREHEGFAPPVRGCHCEECRIAKKVYDAEQRERTALNRWLKARHAHNAARRFDDAEAEET